MRLSNTIVQAGSPNRTESYGYDDLYRLTSVNYGDGQTQSYTFDPMGNRASKTDVGGGIKGTENYTYDNANRLLTRGAASYTNDSNGNTLTGGGRTNTWDSANRLRSCVYGGVTTTHTYGSDGQRHRTVNGANTTDYILDGPMFVRELKNGLINATYLNGIRGPEYRRDNTTGAVRWYLYDGLGSVSGEVDPNGNVTASRKFDVYGSVRSTTGTSTSKHKFVGSLGHPSEDETGLIYMQARYMDPVTGRFVSEDPRGSGMNWYAYCSNNPVNFTDANGKAYDYVRAILELNGLFAALAYAAFESAPFKRVLAAWLAGVAWESIGFIVSRVNDAGAAMMAGGIALMLASVGAAFDGSLFSGLRSIGAFYTGYSLMLVATWILLDLEVAITTGDGIAAWFAK